MSSYRKVPRKNGSVYELRYSVIEAGKRQHKTETLHSYAALQDRKAEVDRQQRTGTFVDPARGRTTYAELFAKYQGSSKWDKQSPTTQARTEGIYRKFLEPRWGQEQVGRIEYAAVDEWIGEMKRGRLTEGKPPSPATVRKVHGVFRAVLAHGVRTKLLRENPAVGVEVPVPQRREMLFLTANEVRLVAEAIDPRFRALVYLAAYGGLRAGELVGLLRKNLDLLRRQVAIDWALVQPAGQGAEWRPPKNGRTRTCGLPTFLAEILKKHIETYTEGGTGPDAHVFTTAHGHHIEWHNFATNHWRPAVKVALPPEKVKLRFHDLRHTCASLLIANGEHPKVISDWLGHSSIQITMDRYGHLDPRMSAEALARLDATYKDALTDADEDEGGEAAVLPFLR